jgi:hypothetical protein
VRTFAAASGRQAFDSATNTSITSGLSLAATGASSL